MLEIYYLLISTVVNTRGGQFSKDQSSLLSRSQTVMYTYAVQKCGC